MSYDPNNEFEMGRVNRTADNSSAENSMLIKRDEYDPDDHKYAIKTRSEENTILWGYVKLNEGVSKFTVITFFMTQFINGFEMNILLGFP